MLGSWTADHGPRFLALEAKSKQKALAALATKHPGDQSSDDDESGVGDVKESVANKLFGAEAGSGGNGHEPPYEVEEDAAEDDDPPEAAAEDCCFGGLRVIMAAACY